MDFAVASAFAVVFVCQSLCFVWLVDRLASRFERVMRHGHDGEAEPQERFEELRPAELPLDEPRLEEAIAKAMPINELLRKSGHGVSNDGDDAIPALREEMQKGNLTDMNDGTRERIA